MVADTPWLNAALSDFDFEIERCANGPTEPVHLADGRTLTMFAGDASGGAFLFAGEGGEERPVVYAGSEGTGGLIAMGVHEAVAMVVHLPSLHDALVAPLDDGSRLRERLDRAEREISEYRPDVAEIRARVAAALDLPAAAGLLQRLHAAAVDDRYVVVSDQGNRYEPLAVWLRT
ncbi:hypothetical protein ACIA5D_47620 [Actinoplanes sp. NPDC051513]|uniref:hypothetical protein n=1 Tax=Actinoplanes sp. NPDC051513 TaxID=3363908 RepID=UPI00378D1A84